MPLDSYGLRKILEQLRDPEYIPVHEEKELLMFLLAGLVTKDISSAHLKWFLSLPREEKDRLMKANWFIPVAQFKVTVPTDYQPDAFLASADKAGFTKIDYRVANGHFNQASKQLMAGKTYTAKIVRAREKFFEIINHMHEANAFQGVSVDFLKEQRAVFCGAPGLLLAYQQGSDKFPHDQQVVMLDELSALPVLSRGEDEINHVPYIYLRSRDNMRTLGAMYYGDVLGDPYLLFLVDEE